MLKINSSKREVVCWLIGTSFLGPISRRELYIVETPNGSEVRWVKTQQPVLYTGKYSKEELHRAITTPALGWRYCEASPKKDDGTFDEGVKICVLVAPNEGFLLLGPGPLEDATE